MKRRPLATRPRPVKPPPSPPRAHVALVPAAAPKPPPRASKRPPSTPPAEPAQAEGATLPRVERDGPTLIKVVDGLRGVVSRWECSATVLGPLASFTRLDGTPARAHPRTVERHRGCVEGWVRGRAAR